jgi:hypothetical protein
MLPNREIIEIVIKIPRKNIMDRNLTLKRVSELLLFLLLWILFIKNQQDRAEPTTMTKLSIAGLIQTEISGMDIIELSKNM